MGPHPPEIVGWWSLMLGYLHRAEESGELTHDVAGWARIMRATPDQAKGCLEYLERSKIADVTFCNGNVTVVNRRMKRERLEKENTRLRVAKHRCNAQCNGDVTVKKKEERGKKEEYKNKNPPNPPKGGSVRASKISIPEEMEKLRSRYKNQKLIDDAFQAIARTRKNGEVQGTILLAQLRRWDTKPVEVVESGISLYLENGHADEGKGENYLWGIIRSQANKPKGELFKSKPKPQGRDLPWGD